MTASPVPRLRRGRRPHSRRRIVLATGVALLLLAAAPVAWVQGTGQTRVRTLTTADRAPVALVLGAGLRPDGSPSTYLRRRLDAAAELYRQGTVEVILVSGDRRNADYDEPAAMRRWLLDHGIPDGRIVRDDYGLDTHDSCVRAHDVFGVDKSVVITQDYHLRRALFSCAGAGVTATGVPVSSTSVEPVDAVWYRIREGAASVKSAWDRLTSRAPVGPQTPSNAVADAMATPR